MNANQLPAKTRAARFTAVLATAALALTGCAGTTENAQPSNTIDYWMWDTSQLPSYQKCAAGFEKANPDLKVKITQYGWDDYWSKLTASFIAGTGPDVFTNHVSQYPQFVSLDVLAPLDDFKDIQGVDQEAFQDGLKDLWTGPDGKQYGMPKDWDTIAMYYNQKILDEAGAQIARDLARYDVGEVLKIVGVRSGDFEAALGYAGGPVVVHADDLALRETAAS